MIQAADSFLIAPEDQAVDSNEAKNGLSNRGTIAMARTPDPNRDRAVLHQPGRQPHLDFVVTNVPKPGAMLCSARSSRHGRRRCDQGLTGPKVRSADVPTTDVVIEKVEILP
jgi:hypothetical protein